jgi:uncharacterized protein (TIGR02147 family)
MSNLFEAGDYKDYLQTRIRENSAIKGYKTALASAAGCQKPYFSQVINSHIHLTPEHAMGLALYWNLNEKETEYWLTLVHLARTSFPPLVRSLNAKLEMIRKESRDLARRYPSAAIEEFEQQSVYYSSWIYGAIHLLVESPFYRSPQALAKRLHLPVEVVNRKAADLERIGLLRKNEGKYESTNRFLHLPKESPLNLTSHHNWRSQALLDVSDEQPDSVHYTAVQALSRADALAVRSLVLEFLDAQRKIVAPSPSEEAYCLTLDWFLV